MIKMAKKLSFMVKTVQAELIALSRDSHRRFLNNALTAPVACNVIEGRRLKRKVENHALPYFVFTCVLRGGGELSLHQKNYKLKPGSAFLRFAGETFSIGRSADYVEYSLVLPADFGLLLKKYGPPDGRVFELELDVPLLNAFRELFDLTRTVNSDALPGAAIRILQFVNQLRPTVKSESGFRDAGFAATACAILQKKLVSANPGRETAARIGMGYELFRKRFREAAGLSPKQYVMQLKFEKAAEMILKGRTIKETAFELGYTEMPAFSRQFRKYYGISPAEYRRASKLEYL